MRMERVGGDGVIRDDTFNFQIVGGRGGGGKGQLGVGKDRVDVAFA